MNVSSLSFDPEATAALHNMEISSEGLKDNEGYSPNPN
jgi:hypothetical protein